MLCSAKILADVKIRLARVALQESSPEVCSSSDDVVVCPDGGWLRNEPDVSYVSSWAVMAVMNLKICKRNRLIPHNNEISLKIPSNISERFLITTHVSASKFPNRSAVVHRNVKYTTCSTSIHIIPPAQWIWLSVMLVNMSSLFFEIITSRCLESNQAILYFQFDHIFFRFAFS